MESERKNKMRKIGLRVVLFTAISILLLYSISKQWREHVSKRDAEEEHFSFWEREGDDSAIDREYTLEKGSEEAIREDGNTEALETNNDFAQTASAYEDSATTTISALEAGADVEEDDGLYDELNDDTDVFLDAQDESSREETYGKNNDEEEEEGEEKAAEEEAWSEAFLMSWLHGYFYDDEEASSTASTTTVSGENVTVNLAVSDDQGTTQRKNEMENEMEQGGNADVNQPSDTAADDLGTYAKSKFAAFSFFAQNRQTTTPDQLDNDNNSDDGENDEFQDKEGEDEEKGDYLVQNHPGGSENHQGITQETDPNSSNEVSEEIEPVKVTTQTRIGQDYDRSAYHPYADITENDKERDNSSSGLALDQNGNKNANSINEVADDTAGEPVTERLTESSTNQYSFLLSLQKLSEVKKEGENDTQNSLSPTLKERIVLLLKSLYSKDSIDEIINDTSHSNIASDYARSDLSQSKEVDNERTDFQSGSENMTTSTISLQEKPVTATEPSVQNTLVSPPVETESRISQETEAERADGSAIRGQLEERNLQSTVLTTTLQGETIIPHGLDLALHESLSSSTTSRSTEKPISLDSTILEKQKQQAGGAAIGSQGTVEVSKREVREGNYLDHTYTHYDDAVHPVNSKDGEQNSEEGDDYNKGIDDDNGDEVPKVFQDLDVRENTNSWGQIHDEETTIDTEEHATGSRVPLTSSNNGLANVDPRPLSDDDLKVLRTTSYKDRMEPEIASGPEDIRNNEDSVKANAYVLGVESSLASRYSDHDHGNVKVMSSCLPPTALSKSTHPITALVSIPGSPTDWMRRALEQLAGEPSDSIYRVIARMDKGDTTPLWEMNRRVVIETHANFTRRFDRGILLLRNPLAVEPKHLHFRPLSTDWLRNFLWSRHVVSWLETDIPVMVITYEDMVENVEGYLSMIADFLKIVPKARDLACAMEETPPDLIDDVSRISGVYSLERRLVAQAIDRVIKTAAKTYPHILRRLYMYRSSTGVP